MAALQMAGHGQVISLSVLRDLSYDLGKFREWLIANRLLPSEKVCSKCNSHMNLLGDRNGLGLFRCLGSHPRGGIVQEAASNGTWFQESTFPSDIVLILTYCFARKLVYETAATEVSCKLNLSHRTIADWYALCRQVCMASLGKPSIEKIGGPGVNVEVDQYKIGRLKYKAGILVQGSWLVGMIAQDGGVQFAVYPDGRKNLDAFMSIIQKHVEPGSVIISNCWKLFGVSQEDMQNFSSKNLFTFKEPSSQEGIDSILSHNFSSSSDELICKIESQWHAVRQILLDKGIRRRELAPHLCEYIWRRNAKSRGDVFCALLQDIAKLYPNK